MQLRNVFDLVLADARGFHRRGAGTPGATRLALYASLRIRPFSLLFLAALGAPHGAR